MKRRAAVRVCATPGCGHAESMHAGGPCVGVIEESGSPSFSPHGSPSFCTCPKFIPLVTGLVSTRTIMEMRASIWSEQLGHVDAPAGPAGRPYWRASSLGYCMRRQCMWRAGIPETRTETPEEATDKERRFAWGNSLEEHVVDELELAGVLIARQVPVLDVELSLSGHIDAVWGGIPGHELPGRVGRWSEKEATAILDLRERLSYQLAEPIPATALEVKTTHSWAVRKMHADGPRLDHRMQPAAYLIMGRSSGILLGRKDIRRMPIERAELIVVGRDAVRPLVYWITTADVEEATERLGVLNEAWASGHWPACDCGTVEGMTWAQKFCPYVDPEDPSTCCGTSLLDRLEKSVEATA